MHSLPGPEPGLARWEARIAEPCGNLKEGARWGNHGFPHPKRRDVAVVAQMQPKSYESRAERSPQQPNGDVLGRAAESRDPRRCELLPDLRNVVLQHRGSPLATCP